jgi:hypothetical protein
MITKTYEKKDGTISIYKYTQKNPYGETRDGVRTTVFEYLCEYYE